MRFLLTLALAASLLGQITPDEADNIQQYIVTREVSLSGSGETVTIQAPAGNAKRIYLRAGMVYCSVACTVMQAKNGSAATTTALTPVPLNGTGTPTARAYRSSNVGVGSVLPTIQVGAGQQMTLDLSGVVFGRGAAGVQNYSVSTASMTGVVRISIIWGERP